MFVRAETTGGQGASQPGWYPLRLNLDIKYWQKVSGGEYSKEMVNAWVHAVGLSSALPLSLTATLATVLASTSSMMLMYLIQVRFRDYHKPELTLRGHEYDLRITFTPCTWLEVCDGLSLSKTIWNLITLLPT